MELRHLRYFVTVAEELNLSRASARLRISQPAVSRQIKDLEDELGVKLLARNGHGVSLTSAGKSFLAHARDLLQRSAAAVTEMKRLQKASTDKLRVGYIAPVLAAILTPALRCMEQEDPDIDVDLLELSPAEQANALRDQKIDIAFLGNPCPELYDEFTVIVLDRIRLDAVLPDNHILALRKEIKLQELATENFVGFSERTFPGRNDSICRACQKAGFTPKIRKQVDSISALLAQIAAGKGVSLAPTEVSRLAHPHTAFVRLKSPVPYVMSGATYRKDSDREALKKFLKCCRDTARTNAIHARRHAAAIR